MPDPEMTVKEYNRHIARLRESAHRLADNLDLHQSKAIDLTEEIGFAAAIVDDIRKILVSGETSTTTTWYVVESSHKGMGEWVRHTGGTFDTPGMCKVELERLAKHRRLVGFEFRPVRITQTEEVVKL